MRMSDEEFIEILKTRLKELDEELKALLERQKQIDDMSISLTSRIHGITLEKQELTNQINSFTERNTYGERAEHRLEKNDDKYADFSSKASTYNTKIQELQELRNKTTSSYKQHKFDRRIEKINEKLKKVKAKGAKIQSKQRKILYSKMKKDAKKHRLLTQAAGRVMTYQDRYETNRELSDGLKDKKAFGKVASKIYDMKANHYKKRLDRSTEILNEMNSRNSIIAMRGARITSLNKRIVKKLRNRSGALSMDPGLAPAM